MGEGSSDSEGGWEILLRRQAGEETRPGVARVRSPKLKHSRGRGKKLSKPYRCVLVEGAYRV